MTALRATFASLCLVLAALAGWALSNADTAPADQPGGGVVVSVPSALPTSTLGPGVPPRTPPSPTPSLSATVPVDAAENPDPSAPTGSDVEEQILATAATFIDTLSAHEDGFKGELKKLAIPESHGKIDSIGPDSIPDLGKVTGARFASTVNEERTDVVLTMSDGSKMDVSMSFRAGAWGVWGWAPHR